MNERTLMELINFLKTASPLVWNIMMKQVYSNAFMQLILGIVLLLLAFISFKGISYSQRKIKEEGIYSNWDEIKVLSTISSFAFTIFGIVIIGGAIQIFYNPEFYAIKYVLENLAGG